MARIFISYKRVDKDKVFKIKDQIESALGEKCWIDLDGIESDAQFADVIIKAINECEVFLFMYSAVHSQITDYKHDWTVRELDFAQHKQKRIVFVNLDASPLSDWFYMLFGTKQQVDATSSHALLRLISDLEKWLNLKIDRTQTGSTANGVNDILSISRCSKLSKIAGKNSFLSILSRYSNNFNFLPLLLSVVLLVLGCVNEWSSSTYISIIWIIFFSSFVLMIGAIFNKHLFGLRKIYHAFAYYVPAMLIFIICYVEAICNDPDKTQQPNDYVSDVSVERIKPVDLGLPSGTLWADRNVGADSISGYGDLYLWGEVKVKTDNGDECYGEVNASNIIGTEFDVATTELGKGWQMPSVNQFNELMNECKWKWEGNGFRVVGRNGNYIFLPASGWLCDTVVEYRNEYGYYWSGEKVNSKFAKGLLFSKSEQYVGNCTLHKGRNVRAVKKKINKY